MCHFSEIHFQFDAKLSGSDDTVHELVKKCLNKTCQQQLSIHMRWYHFCRKCNSCDFSPQSVCCEHLSCPAQLLTGAKERQVSLPVEHNTLNSALLNHTEEGAEGGRLGDELCTHAVLVSLGIHAQSGITKLLLLWASNQQHAQNVRVQLHYSYPAMWNMNNYRYGFFTEALKAHKQAGLSTVISTQLLCRPNIKPQS